MIRRWKGKIINNGDNDKDEELEIEKEEDKGKGGITIIKEREERWEKNNRKLQE